MNSGAVHRFRTHTARSGKRGAPPPMASLPNPQKSSTPRLLLRRRVDCVEGRLMHHHEVPSRPSVSVEPTANSTMRVETLSTTLSRLSDEQLQSMIDELQDGSTLRLDVLVPGVVL